MAEFPLPITEYAIASLLQSRRPAFLQIDDEGTLLDWGGETSFYGLDALHRLKAAAEQFPLLTGALPLKGHETIFLGVSTLGGAAADVHLFSGGGCVWVLLLDASEQVRRQSALQQRLYDLLLGRSQTHESVEFSVELLASFDLLAMEQTDSGALNLLEPLPSWLAHFCDDIAPGVRPASVLSAFPFLQNFVTDAEQFWSRNESGRLRSGPWHETQRDGSDMVFEATAVRIGNQNILVVEALKEKFEDRRSIIQAAREKSLEVTRLERERQRLDILFHCIAHDLAGMMMGIKGPLSLLSRQTLAEEQRSLVQIATRQATRQEGLLRDLLDALSPDAAARQNGLAPTDLISVAKDVVASAAAAFPSRTARLVVETPAPTFVLCDRSRLERIFWNLLENGLRYSPRGHGVTVAVSRANNHIFVRIDDEGPGVPADLQPRLFQRFSRGRDGTGKAGLGLFFCRITVERWGGAIGYQALTPTGSRFWFRLPENTGPNDKTTL